MWRIVFRRLLVMLPVLWAAVTLTFFLIRLAPGGPFMDERSYPPEALARLHSYYGLDQPLPVQYFRYMGNLLRGDLGPSFKYTGRGVNEIIAETFPVSLELGIWAMLYALALGIGMGVLAALRPNSWWDHATMGFAMAGICLPSFVLGPLLVLAFALGTGWFNAQGWNTASDRILPAVTLGAVYAAYIARLSRAGMLEVLPQDFIRTARAKGLSEWRVIMLHAFRPGMLPTISFLGPAFAGIITGSFVVETLFHIPGMGRMFVMSAFNRDYSLVLGLVVFFAAIIVVCNTAVDLLLAAMNPRMRQEA